VSVPSSAEASYIPHHADFKELRKVENIKDEYDLGKLLGQGGFGSVNMCTDKTTGQKFAIKSVCK